MAEIDLSALRAKAETADAVAPPGWEADRERMTDAPEKHHEFFAIDGAGNRMFGTENADAAFGLIEVEDGGDGFVAAWNENSRRVIEFAVAAQPRVVLALLDRVEKAEALIAKSAKDTPVYKAVERVLDEKSAWVARPNSGVTMAIAIAATLAAIDAVERIWLPISTAPRVSVNRGSGMTMHPTMTTETLWVRDEDGRVYEAWFVDGTEEIGRTYWWDCDGEEICDPVEWMPHPLWTPEEETAR